MAEDTGNLDKARAAVQTTQALVLGPPRPVAGAATRDAESPGVPHFSTGAYQHGVGVAIQSIAQSTAIAIQDATDLMRNVSTVETTAIGAATAKWIGEPQNLLYKEIIEGSLQTIKEAADVYKTIGDNTSYVLKLFEKDGDRKDGDQ